MFLVALLLNLRPAMAGVIWKESFEGATVEERWSVEGGAWQIGTPAEFPKSPSLLGGQLAGTVLDANYSENLDASLVRESSFLVPPAEEEPRLRFLHWFEFGAHDLGRVLVQVVGTNTWDELATFSAHGSGVWSRPSLDLGKYAGSKLRLRFHLLSQLSNDNYDRWIVTSVGRGWYLDDVELETGPRPFANPEGFESEASASGWSVDHGVWQIGSPTSGPGKAFSGTNVAATVLAGPYLERVKYDSQWGWPPEIVESRLISPVFTVPPADLSPRLRFHHWFQFGADDFGQIQICTNGQDWTMLSRIQGSGGGLWSYPSMPLEQFSGVEIQIAFQFHCQVSADNYGKWTLPSPSFGWYIDDVKIVSDAINLECPTPTVVTEGDTLGCRITSPPGAGELNLALGAPAGLRLDPLLGLLTWLPSEAQGPSTNLVTIQLVDSSSNLQPLDSETLEIVVTERNEPPRFDSQRHHVLEAGKELRLKLGDLAYDPDWPAQSLSFTLGENAPQGAVVDNTMQELRWTPSPEQAQGTRLIDLVVTDDGTPPLSTNLAILFGPPSIGFRTLLDRTLEIDAGDLELGRRLILQSTEALSDSTQWTEISTNEWTGKPFRIPNGKGYEFFRLRIE